MQIPRGQALRAPPDTADGGGRLRRVRREHLPLRDDGQVGGASHLLDGAVRLPGVADLEWSVAEWQQWGRWARRRSGAFFLKSCIATVTTWYHDQLCRDMGHSPRRKDGLLAEWLQPYGPTDYAGIQ